jgi:hypothetical protein
VGLGIDACAHLDLASTYAEAVAPISESAAPVNTAATSGVSTGSNVTGN